ncbi:hypothetical protein LTR62_006506 [Meristemomyces frigidus]|uniref:PWI domain-containing protein n=1 Tax=Meristemomyces frigidus TaxID=1508187 RepID=A0AAN7TC53_9PEZI|nr:hypothetical protein LTR62_006506 [Meristemomyces frigidus]
MSSKLTTDVDKRLLRTTKFPPEFNTKVDMTKVNIPVIKKWVSDGIEKILGIDDDVVTDTIFNLIEGPKYPNIKELQISLNGFLDKDAPKFCADLWKLCLSAQDNPQGIPKELLEAKKMELIQERLEEDKAREEASKRQEAEREREAEIARTRDRERSERDRGRVGRHGRDFDRRAPRRDSRSPPPRRRDRDDFYREPSRIDSYVPGRSRRDHDRPQRRRRSPSYDRARSRTRSPPPRRKRRSSFSPSRSPPRRRRRTSSSDGDEKARKAKRDMSRSRSPPKHRSRSPRRHRRRSPSSGNKSRSPQHEPTRRFSRSKSRSPPRKKCDISKTDLLAVNKAKRNEPRLSREPEDGANGGAEEVGIPES